MSSLLSLLSAPKESTEYIQHHLGNLAVGHGLLSLNIDEILVSWVVAGIVLFIAWRVGRHLQTGTPSGVQNALESIVEFVNDQTKALYPRADPLIGPLALTVFVWVLVMNAMDLVPVDFFEIVAQAIGLGFGVSPSAVHFRQVPTAGLSVPFALALSVFALSLLYAIRTHGILGYLKGYVTHPFGIWLAPMNIVMTLVEEVAKPLSLALRLFGNMFAGDLIFVLIALLGFTWFMLPAQGLLDWLWTWFETLIILIQAFIFMLLTVVYLAMASNEESH
ncbi:MAG TPA: F0F1 ATP synthase subunit A [Nevskiaceae bacterium]|nr:F0F1 ATP synthase subunit A [Nevskiaceae bacterium]